jgi:hypothetical protein
MLLYETGFSEPNINEEAAKTLPASVLCRVTYPICNINELNQNNRMYEKAVWDKVLEDDKVNEKIQGRTLLGEAEHPAEETRTRLDRSISHIVNRMWVDESQNKVFAEMDVVNTPAGRIINTLLEAGSKVGVSTRAEGELEEQIDEAKGKYMRVIPESYLFETIDFTADPSTYQAVPMSVDRNIVRHVESGIKEGTFSTKSAVKILENLKSSNAKDLSESLVKEGYTPEAPDIVGYLKKGMVEDPETDEIVPENVLARRKEMRKDKKEKVKEEQELEESVTSKNREALCKKIVKNPAWGSGMDVSKEEAEAALRKEFKYTDDQIKKLKEEIDEDEVVTDELPATDPVVTEIPAETGDLAGQVRDVADKASDAINKAAEVVAKAEEITQTDEPAPVTVPEPEGVDDIPLTPLETGDEEDNALAVGEAKVGDVKKVLKAVKKGSGWKVKDIVDPKEGGYIDKTPYLDFDTKEEVRDFVKTKKGYKVEFVGESKIEEGYSTVNIDAQKALSMAKGGEVVSASHGHAFSSNAWKKNVASAEYSEDHEPPIIIFTLKNSDFVEVELKDKAEKENSANEKVYNKEVVDKLQERLNALREDYMRETSNLDIVSAELKESKVLLEQVDALKEELEENKQKLQEREKQLTKAVKEQIRTASKSNKDLKVLVESTEKKKVELKENTEKEFIKRYAHALARNSGYTLPKNSLILLENCQTEEEVEILFEDIKGSLNESLLHSDKITEIKVINEDKGKGSIIEKQVTGIMKHIS